jgi:hypothetical protein
MGAGKDLESGEKRRIHLLRALEEAKDPVGTKHEWSEGRANDRAWNASD